MPIPDPSFSWQDATAAFAIIAVVAFLVTWVVTDLGVVHHLGYREFRTRTARKMLGGALVGSGL